MHVFMSSPNDYIDFNLLILNKKNHNSPEIAPGLSHWSGNMIAVTS